MDMDTHTQHADIPPQPQPQPTAPNPSPPTPSDPSLFNLPSQWPTAHDLAGSALPCRLEGELASLVVLGTIPPSISGTFYRITTDPFMPPHPQNVPLDGDGNISAFRFYAGRVDMKMRYVETERYKLERRANKALFGLYRNPFTHHPCVRAAVDSTANTNLVFWANKLLALKEGALPYAVDPDSLETLEYDPFRGQVQSKTFTAHPKYDPFVKRLVCFGYEAKGLATRDVVTYELDEEGKKTREFWLKAPWCALIHDCAITPNFIVLFLWPFEANVARMKAGKHHWAWSYDRPATFIVVPRFQGAAAKFGWEDGEHRVYAWKNCMPIHTAGAWEDESTGSIYVESSRVHDNVFPFFPPDDGRMPSPKAKADFVRWEIDPSAPTGTTVPDPLLVLDLPSEFPRIDERLLTKRYKWVFLNVFIPEESDGSKSIFHGLNGLAMHNNRTGETRYFRAGKDSLCQEPIFIPRTADADEADGWVMTLIERRAASRCDVAVIDTRNFEKPVAIVQLPFHVKAQVHGNWVPESALAEKKSLVRIVAQQSISGLGALEPMEP